MIKDTNIWFGIKLIWHVKKNGGSTRLLAQLTDIGHSAND